VNKIGCYFSIWVLLFTAISCSETQAKNLTVSVNRTSDGEHWRVVYELPMTTDEIQFERNVNTFRESYWSVKTPGVRIINKDGKEYLSGKNLKRVVLEFPSHYKKSPRDYEFHKKFTDGSAAIYTGYLNLDSYQKTHFIFSSDRNESIMLLGRSTKEQLKWLADTKATYVYFGNIDPLEDANVLAIIDPGLPNWIKTSFLDLLPKIFQFYKSQTNITLNFKPFILLSYQQPKRRNSYSYRGGVLPGFVQLTFTGRPWQKKEDIMARRLLKFLAHESAHFWNAEMFMRHQGEGEDYNWMHEGGADTFAYRVLLHFGVIDDKSYKSLLSDAVSRCVLGLNGIILAQSRKVGRSKNYYDCGSTIGLIAEQFLKKKRKDFDAFTLWGEIFKAASKQNNEYSEEIFFTTLKKLLGGGDLNLIRSLQRLTKDKIEKPDLFFKKLLTKAGVGLAVGDEHAPEALKIGLLSKVIKTILRSDCTVQRSFRFQKKQNFFLVRGSKHCKILKKTWEIDRVDGFDLLKNWSQIYDQVKNKCQQGRTVDLGVRGSANVLKIVCNKPIGDRPLSFSIKSLNEDRN